MDLRSYPVLSKARIVTMRTVASPVKSLYSPPGTGERSPVCVSGATAVNSITETSNTQRDPCNKPQTPLREAPVVRSSHPETKTKEEQEERGKHAEKDGEVGEGTLEVEEDTEEKGGQPQPPSRNEDGWRKREQCATCTGINHLTHREHKR